MNPKDVIIIQAQQLSGYPKNPPFHPCDDFPEYCLNQIGSEPNSVYQQVRDCFRLAELDSSRFGTPEWNPLGELINPGETVLLKPNLVKEDHPRDPNGWQYVLTHGSVIRAVADYVWLALQGKGKIIVADAPQTDSSFKEIEQVLGLGQLRDFYNSQDVDFEIVDLRSEEWTNKDGVIVERRKLAGDPLGYIAFDLGERSEFSGHAGADKYYGADYDTKEINYHHSGGRHEYLISGTAMHADVIFSLPKLKTHKKAGITVTLKNLVGINGDKNWLPHHTEGDPATGGDERPCLGRKGKTERSIVAFFRNLSLKAPLLGPRFHRIARKAGSQLFGDTGDVIRSGNWWGNDTVWRMCLDLNKIALYGRIDGFLKPPAQEHRRRHYALVDGIIAGEGSGPMDPDPVNTGILLFGLNPASVDAACAYIMGFDPEKIPIVKNAFHCSSLPIAEWGWKDISIISNTQEWNTFLPSIADKATFHFTPHYGWKDNIERNSMHNKPND
ncbi:MAG: DUF362 domain-containing protein [Desulfobacteraceae bacterium]|nr:DUF362 domain-containing protein [Desulfobacteraceae bacterium]